MSFNGANNRATISGTPTGSASGTYNYIVTAINSTGTASASYTGDITITASSTLVPCSGTLTLSSGPATQTVSASTAITNVFYQLSTNCTDTTTVSATGLPPGVTMTWDKAVRPSTISSVSYTHLTLPTKA